MCKKWKVITVLNSITAQLTLTGPATTLLYPEPGQKQVLLDLTVHYIGLRQTLCYLFSLEIDMWKDTRFTVDIWRKDMHLRHNIRRIEQLEGLTRLH